MWFATREKVEREIDKLLDQFETLHSRAKNHMADEAVLASILGPNELARKIARNCNSIGENLPRAQAQGQFGTRTWKEIARDLPEVAKVAQEYRILLNEMDVSRSAGQMAAEGL